MGCGTSTATHRPSAHAAHAHATTVMVRCRHPVARRVSSASLTVEPTGWLATLRGDAPGARSGGAPRPDALRRSRIDRASLGILEDCPSLLGVFLLRLTGG